MVSLRSEGPSSRSGILSPQAPGHTPIWPGAFFRATLFRVVIAQRLARSSIDDVQSGAPGTHDVNVNAGRRLVFLNPMVDHFTSSGQRNEKGFITFQSKPGAVATL